MTTAVAKNEMKDIMGFLQSPAAVASLRAACVKHLTPERLLRVVGAAMNRNPALLECTKESLFIAVSCCGQLGLEPNLLGDAYLVPYNNNKTGKKEVQFQPGYRGLVMLARRSGEISTIGAEAVFEKDEFEYELGDNAHIKHVPSTDEDPGEMVGAYAITKFKDGGIQRTYMTRAEIDKIRNNSPAWRNFLKYKKDCPWASNYVEMAKKTVIRRHCKLLPLTIELSEALERDMDADFDISATVVPAAAFPDAGTEENAEPSGAAAKALAAAKKAAGKEKTLEDVLNERKAPVSVQNIIDYHRAKGISFSPSKVIEDLDNVINNTLGWLETKAESGDLKI